MTPETETALSSAGRNFRNGSDAKITHASETLKKSSARNGFRQSSRGGCTERGSHQGCVGRGERFNRPAYTSSIRNFNLEVNDFGAVLGNNFEQREAKDQHKRFSKNLSQYILRELQNPLFLTGVGRL